jgi:hypothetical protein
LPTSGQRQALAVRLIASGFVPDAFAALAPIEPDGLSRSGVEHGVEETRKGGAGWTAAPGLMRLRLGQLLIVVSHPRLRLSDKSYQMTVRSWPEIRITQNSTWRGVPEAFSPNEKNSVERCPHVLGTVASAIAFLTSEASTP